jgi:hypothetical protein
MSSWGCPHENDRKCARVNDLPCDPGMKGCVLFGRFIWADKSKNRLAGGWGDNKSNTPPDENGAHRGSSESD